MGWLLLSMPTNVYKRVLRWIGYPHLWYQRFITRGNKLISNARNHLKSPEITWNHLKSMKSLEITWNQWNRLKSPEIIRNHPKSSEIIWNHLKSSEIIWNHLKSPEITWNHLKSLEIIAIEYMSSFHNFIFPVQEKEEQ